MQVTCQGCGNVFEGKRSTAKFCSATCRQRGHRRGDEPAAAVDEELVTQTRKALERLGKIETVEGQQALVVARRMCSSFETGAAVAALSKEHSRLMGILSRGAVTKDPVQAAKDEVARKRAQRTG